MLVFHRFDHTWVEREQTTKKAEQRKPEAAETDWIFLN